MNSTWLITSSDSASVYCLFLCLLQSRKTIYYIKVSGMPSGKHRHAKRAKVIFFVRAFVELFSYSNDLVKFSWLRYTARKKLGIHDTHTMLHR